MSPERTTFMLMGGGAGMGQLAGVAERLLALPGDFQLVVLAGKNAQALADLRALAARFPGRVFPQGFTHQVERLMACADLIITKPGGLTTSECMAMGLPMVVNAPIPGQEERNADHLLEQGVALKAMDAVTLEYRIQWLLAQPAKLAAMRERSRAIGRGDAGRALLDVVLA
jgi:processive 1,2-diacylglycerol beta-glucosyltransferase